jgi:hypothetical protein
MTDGNSSRFYTANGIMLDGKSFEMMMAMAFSLTISLDYDSRLYTDFKL